MRAGARLGHWLKLLGMVGLLAACASTPDPEPRTAHQARLRVYHGPSVWVYFGDRCDGKDPPVIRAGEGGFSFLVPNKRIGMPQTEDRPSFSFHEYAIPAAQPVTIRTYWQAQLAGGAWERCGPLWTTFEPEPNQDYEVSLKFVSGMCQGVELRKLRVSAEARVLTTPVMPTVPTGRLCFR